MNHQRLSDNEFLGTLLSVLLCVILVILAGAMGGCDTVEIRPDIEVPVVDLRVPAECYIVCQDLPEWEATVPCPDDPGQLCGDFEVLGALYKDAKLKHGPECERRRAACAAALLRGRAARIIR